MSFDLNIDNYTKQELASLFDLPPNYDDSILEIKESKLRENIMKNTEIQLMPVNEKSGNWQRKALIHSKFRNQFAT
jgi:hypothetical protein